MFGFGKNKEVCKCEAPCELKVTEDLVPKSPVITRAFGFKTHLKYKDGVGANSWEWSSDLYYDYRKAVQASYDIVKTIYNDLNADPDKKFMFTIDSCLLKENFLTATSSNVYEIVFADGQKIAQNDILVDEGSNVILPVEAKLYNKV